MRLPKLLLVGGLAAGFASAARGEIKVANEHRRDSNATGFQLEQVPPPALGDAASQATFSLLRGARDENGGDLSALHDGKVPRGGDEPSENFFFRPGDDGGRLRIDLGKETTIKQVNTYSWHAGTRGPQAYALYASDGAATGFDAEPKGETAPESFGWKLLAHVDTRPKDASPGGQHAVSVYNSEGNLGRFRFLLFDIHRTEDTDSFGNTFFSEIDVVDPDSPVQPIVAQERKSITKSFDAKDGRYRFTVDSTLAPDLTEWADKELRPVVQEWYPRLVDLLPSDDFVPRTNVTLRFREDMKGTPASASGGFINMNAAWFRKELSREARGSVVHEMVHVVQNYRGGGRSNPNATRMPGWLVEGIPDYIRWFLYEPQTRGAEITTRNLERAKYDASYRISGNFLNWVSQTYDPKIVVKLNAAGRAGTYGAQVWKDSTGKTVEELGLEWRKLHEDRLAATQKTESPAAEPKKTAP